jgi:hypothetical protein
MRDDPVIERIRKVRIKISEEHGHDTMRLIRHYQEMERKTTRKFFKRVINENKAA